MTFKDFSHYEVQMLCIQEIAAKRVSKKIVLLGKHYECLYRQKFRPYSKGAESH